MQSTGYYRVNTVMKINEIISRDSRKRFVGTCVNSFDEDGDCIIPELAWDHTSAFAVDEENAVPVQPMEFNKVVAITPDVAQTFTGHQISYLRTEDHHVYMIYDHDTDVHYFFV